MTLTTNEATIPTMQNLASVPPGQGDHRFFFNHLATIKVAAGESTTGMNAVEFEAPRGFSPPLHKHRYEDEIMYVIDGEISLQLGDETSTVSSGTVVSLPAGIPHIFQVLSDSARFITITSGGGGHPTFDEFVRALSTPTDPDSLPAPINIDPGKVAAISADFGIEVLGPPLAALD